MAPTMCRILESRESLSTTRSKQGVSLIARMPLRALLQ